MAVQIEDFGGNVLFSVTEAEYEQAKVDITAEGKIKLNSGSNNVPLDFWCYEYSERNKDTLLAELVNNHGVNGDNNHFVVARMDTLPS